MSQNNIVLLVLRLMMLLHHHHHHHHHDDDDDDVAAVADSSQHTVVPAESVRLLRIESSSSLSPRTVELFQCARQASADLGLYGGVPSGKEEKEASENMSFIH
jgi:hypothetical protein